MNLRSFRETDREPAAGVFSRGLALLPRNPHILGAGLFGPLARDMFRKSVKEGDVWPEGISIAEDDGKIVGALSALPSKDPEVGIIRWLAVEDEARAEEIAALLLERGLRFLRAKNCAAARVSAWGASEHLPLFSAMEKAGFLRQDPYRHNILMGCPITDLPPLPALEIGYSAHPFRPGDEGRWLLAKNIIFETQDPPGTFEQLYSTRSTFQPDEVVFVECGDELVAISAGVDHYEDIVGKRCRIAYLDWVGVKSEHRGKRLGNYICLACMHYLRRRGNSYCTLITQPYRAAAVRLYEKLGFRTAAEQRVYDLDLHGPGL